MTAPVNFYADFAQLTQLKGAAQREDPQALREAARQFESLFTQMMLKSMRAATSSLTDGERLMDSDQSDMYREMFDNQIAAQLSKGRGLGLAEMMVRQMTPLSTRSPPASPSPSMGEGRGEGAGVGAAIAKQPLSLSLSRNVRENPSISVHAQREVVASPATPRQKLPIAASPIDFVKQMWPHAQAAARELGVDAKTLIAHAALETGWGKFVPCNPDGSCSFNLFGIKANKNWQGGAVTANTLEFENGVAVQQQARFRAYESPAESFRDYAVLIKSNPRYVAAVGSGVDARKFASALQQGGYATDPNYAQKLTATTMGVIARVADWLGNEFKPELKVANNVPLATGSGVSKAGAGGERT